MELRQLEYFCLAAKAGSFSAAAKNSYVTQQTLSAAIASLEGELGAALFYRKKHGIELTRFGSLAFERCTAILENVRDLEAQLADFHHAEETTIGFAYATACLPIDGTGFTLQEFKRFQALHPTIDVRLFELSSDACLAALNHGTADLAFIAGEPDAHTYDFCKLDDAHLLIAVAASHPLTQKTSVRFADLENVEIFPVPDLNLSYKRIVKGYERAGIVPKFAAIPFSLEHAREFVKSGAGVDFSPACYATDPPEGIVYLPLAREDSFTVPLGLASKLGHPEKPAVAELKQFIRALYNVPCT